MSPGRRSWDSPNADPAAGTVCAARYEPLEVEPDDSRTHTCALPGAHPEQPHLCPRCGKRWTLPDAGAGS